MTTRPPGRETTVVVVGVVVALVLMLAVVLDGRWTFLAFLVPIFVATWIAARQAGRGRRSPGLPDAGQGGSDR